ncbi:MAG: hypothetical protein ACLFVK_04280 [Dehalococcoidia bacterium]
MRKIHPVSLPATICLMLILFSLPSPVLAQGNGPQLYNAQAHPVMVNTGTQPGESPLILSVEIPGPGGEISSVIIDLDRLTGAKFYDPVSDKIKDVGVDNPMHRVYEIDGKEAYLVGTKSTSAHIYREYRKTLSHERIKSDETPDPTNKWQVELPHAGNTECNTRLRVIATNVFNEQGHVFLPLEVVDDSNAPELSLSAKYPTNSSIVRPGDKVVIKAEAMDNSSEVFSVRLGGESARAIFGDCPTLAFTKQSEPGIWTVGNNVAPETKNGAYTIQVHAIDRSGNENVEAVDIEVKRNISSLQLDLHQGWNLISVPKKLEEPAISKVFSDMPVESVRTMVGNEWLEVDEIIPGRGYLVKSSDDVTLTCTFEENIPSTMPPAVNFEQGWNLIGYASQTLESEMPLRFYLGDGLKDKWSVLYTENWESARYQSTKPYVWASDNFPTTTGEAYSDNPSANLPVVELGKGYWIYFNEGGTLIP